MQYNMEQMSELILKVENQGGRYLEEQCLPVEYDVTGDDKKAASAPFTLDPHPGKVRETLFEVPYEATDTLGRPMGMQPIKLCAVEDAMGLMPRFRQ